MTAQITRTVPLLASLLLVACGGSSSSPSAGNPPGGATSRTARGTIQSKGTGTITVNGVVLSTAGASIRVEDNPNRPETELHHGMVVRVRGTFDDRTGTATEIEFEDHLKGRVRSTSNTSVSSSVDVGGRTVHVEDSTRVVDDRGVDIGFAGLATDDRVRVSGFVDDGGRLRAAGIQRQSRASSDDSFEMKGFVTGLNAGRTQFTLKSSSADAGIVVNVTSLAAAIVEGSYVEVHAASAPSAGAVTASSVQLEDNSLGGQGAEVEIEGIVASGTSASFVIDGQAISTSGSTRWQYGVAGDLAPGVKVEVEGHISSGVLAADKVSFRALVRLQGPATNVTAASYTVLGYTVLRTEFSDESDAAPTEGGSIQVRGYPNAAGTGIVSTRTHQPSGNASRLLLQGLVTAKSDAAGTLAILGVTVGTTSGTKYYRHDQESTDIGKTAFFALVEAGRTVVKARLVAAPSSGAATAEELELEDEP